jgi:hypothetical protein
VEKRAWNWPIWLGFFLSLLAVISYPLLFLRFPVTRDVPWANFLLFAISAVFLLQGLKRVFGATAASRGKIISPILTFISLAVFGLFCFGIFYGSRHLPKSLGAPKVGEKAPDFALRDIHENPVSLASLLSTPLDPATPSRGVPKGVLLVFYRGYW